MSNVKHLTFKVISVVLVMALCLTAVPFAFADEVEPEYITLGTFEGKAIDWQILKSFDVDGNTHQLLITKTVLKKISFNSPFVKNPKFEGSGVYNFLNTGDASFYATAFTEAEKGLIVDHTVDYNYNADGTSTLTPASVTCKVFMPTAADKTSYSLATAGGNYWFCDGIGGAVTNANSPGNKIATVSAAAGVAQTNANIFVRPMIEIDASKIFITADIAEQVVATVGGEEIGKLILDSTLPLTLNITAKEGTSGGQVAVTLNGQPLTGTDGAYVITEGIDGLKANNNVLKAIYTCNYEKYDAALANVDSIHKDFYTDDQLQELNTALATDVKDLPYSLLNQIKVDKAANAINTALENLAADDEAVKEVIAAYRFIVQNKGSDSPDAIAPYTAQYEEAYKDYNFFTDENGRALKDSISEAKDKYEDSEILSGKALYQAKMDAAVAELKPLLDQAIDSKVEKPADNNGKWAQAVADTEKLLTEGNKYNDVEEFNARSQAVIDEYNAEFGDRTPVMSEKEKVQSYIDRVNAIIEECHANENIVKTDYSAFDAALAKAATYVEDHYYKDNEMEGGTVAWEDFVAAYEAAGALLEDVDRDDADNTWNHAFLSQARIDTETKKLESAMSNLDGYVKLNSVQKTLSKIMAFFNKIKYYYDMVTGILETLRGLIKMLIVGDINLYEIFELIGASEKILNFLIKIGIKPPVEEPEPEPQPAG